jgi:hypothetical protein
MAARSAMAQLLGKKRGSLQPTSASGNARPGGSDVKPIWESGERRGPYLFVIFHFSPLTLRIYKQLFHRKNTNSY